LNPIPCSSSFVLQPRNQICIRWPGGCEHGRGVCGVVVHMPFFLLVSFFAPLCLLLGPSR
jgi:hypothetical protein